MGVEDAEIEVEGRGVKGEQSPFPFLIFTSPNWCPFLSQGLLTPF
jgi:hypothetical protein